MNIQQALKLAGQNGKIARAFELASDPTFYLVPTNRMSRILMYADGEQISICWEPKFEDLIADDWVVIGQGIPYTKENPNYFKDSHDKLSRKWII